MRTIFTMTGAERSNPDYISVNRTDDAGVSITIRNGGSRNVSARIPLDPDQARKLATDLLADLDGATG